jgi:hypothetical protein
MDNLAEGRLSLHWSQWPPLKKVPPLYITHGPTFGIAGGPAAYGLIAQFFSYFSPLAGVLLA